MLKNWALENAVCQRIGIFVTIASKIEGSELAALGQKKLNVNAEKIDR